MESVPYRGIFSCSPSFLNLVCGVGLLGACGRTFQGPVRERKHSCLLRSAATCGEDPPIHLRGRRRGGGRVRTRAGEGGPDALSVVADLPAEWNFQRIRSGTEWPASSSWGRGILNRASFSHSGPRPGGAGREQRYIIGAISLADVDGYIADLRSRGILAGSSIRKGTPCLAQPAGSRFPVVQDPDSRE
jgi:hypothetical protein